MKNNRNSSVEKVLKSHSFVGVVDNSFSLIQHGTKLLLVNHNPLIRELFYQLVIRRFGHLPVITLEKPVDIVLFVRNALLYSNNPSLYSDEDGDPEEIAKSVLTKLLDNREMLREYFNITIDMQTGSLLTLPVIIEGYFPAPEGYYYLTIITFIFYYN